MGIGDFFVMSILLSLLLPSVILLWLVHVILFSSYSYKGLWVPITPVRFIASLAIPICMATYGYKRKSLNKSGAIASLFVGFILTVSNYCYMTSMITFFLVCSKLTKFGAKKKVEIEHDYKHGGQRNWIQVVCNGGVPCELAILAFIEYGCGEPLIDFQRRYTISLLSIAVLASLACCCGDTFASEIGSVVGGEPRLITTLRRVPRGTNGGITLCGLLVSTVGGLTLGATYYVTLYLSSTSSAALSANQTDLLWVGAWSGFVGSAIDSLLGATVQYSGYNCKLKKVVENAGTDVKHICGRQILDNHSVNLVSSLLTAIIMPLVAKHYYFQV